MTRFARAEGSKSSNKKTLEEATPWAEMKKQNGIKETHMKKLKLKAKGRKAFNKNIEAPTFSGIVNEKTQLLKKEKTTKKVKINKAEEQTNVSKTKKRKNIEADDPTVSVAEEGALVKQFETHKRNVKSQNTVNKFETGNKNSANTKEDVENKEYVVEDGVKYAVFKKKGKLIKRPWYDLPFEENNVMTRYKNFFVKREMVKELDDYKNSLIQSGLSNSELAKKMLHKERKVHKMLRLELLRKEISNSTADKHKTKISKNLKKNFKLNNLSTGIDSETTSFEKPKTEFHFEENDVMTFYEDHWILRESVPFLQAIYNKKLQRLLNERKDGNRDSPLTNEEQLSLRRMMKKEKRRENRQLKLKLIEDSKTQNSTNNKNKVKKPGKYLGIDYNADNNMTKFGGFWVKKDGAERLEALGEKLRKSGVEEEEVQKILKNERRKEERLLKHERQQFCFRCRQSGHLISLCPQNVNDTDSTGVEICFKCGSTEHMARSCPSNKSDAAYTYATCFICNEPGHISRECPDNPRGLYPDGGCCNECGAVDHLKKDCPERQQEQAKDIIKLPRLSSKRNKDSIEVEEDIQEVEEAAPSVKKSKKKKTKTVVF